jgi:type 1 glutamine amidotransferase
MCRTTACALLVLLVGCDSGTTALPPEICSVTTGAASTLPASIHAPFLALVFSRTTGFRHASIPAGIAAVEVLGAYHDFSVEATADPASFSDANLARFAVVIFLNTTGDVLDSLQQAAFERYIEAGHGFAGVHSASDTEYGWPWYHALVGATFKGHPAIQRATVTVVDTAHASTRLLPNPWLRTDEWYNFTAPPVGVSVLAQVEESTYTGGTMGSPHPISWYHTYDGGRAWYTAMGHTACSYAERTFLDHLAGGIEWAAGVP